MEKHRKVRRVLVLLGATLLLLNFAFPYSTGADPDGSHSGWNQGVFSFQIVLQSKYVPVWKIIRQLNIEIHAYPDFRVLYTNSGPTIVWGRIIIQSFLIIGVTFLGLFFVRKKQGTSSATNETPLPHARSLRPSAIAAIVFALVLTVCVTIVAPLTLRLHELRRQGPSLDKETHDLLTAKNIEAVHTISTGSVYQLYQRYQAEFGIGYGPWFNYNDLQRTVLKPIFSLGAPNTSALSRVSSDIYYDVRSKTAGYTATFKSDNTYSNGALTIHYSFLRKLGDNQQALIGMRMLPTIGSTLTVNPLRVDQR